jgi:hypothetical protein
MLFIAAAALGATSLAAHADVTYSDTEFPNTGWGFETSVIAPGGTSAGTQVSGGNPGFGRQMTNNVNALGTIWGISRFGTTTATRYEPINSGAITSIDWTIDAKWLSGIGGQGQSIALAIKQGAIVYIADVDITGSSGQWITNSATGLTAASFSALSGAGAIDFSGTADPIRVGFAVGNSSTSSAYINVVLYDNFNVVIHNVPAPMAAAQLTVAAALLGMRRRRAC